MLQAGGFNENGIDQPALLHAVPAVMGPLLLERTDTIPITARNLILLSLQITDKRCFYELLCIFVSSVLRLPYRGVRICQYNFYASHCSQPDGGALWQPSSP